MARSTRHLPRRILLVAALLALTAGRDASAQTFAVTNTSDNGPGSLRQAVTDANAYGGAATIRLDANLGTITLGGALPILSNARGLTIDGGSGNAISGGNAYRIFFVDAGAGSVAIKNVTLENGLAKGGDGSGGGGGGGGLGGAVFVNSGAVTLSGMAFAGNAAAGGNGGVQQQSGAGGGGGGLGGVGGNGGPAFGGGGGGGGLGGAGGNNAGGGGGTTGPGGNGGTILPGENPPAYLGGSGGVQNGGAGGSRFNPDGTDANINGGSGGFGGGGGGGGGAGRYQNGFRAGTNGGDGGFGGGGGGAGDGNLTPGRGGFGGGGGGSFAGGYVGGTGGFGGGGGNANSGGFGGGSSSQVLGNGGLGGGSGGAALGANVFVRGDNGASLILANSSVAAGSLTSGLGAPAPADNAPGGDGTAAGSGLFSTGGQLHFTVDSGNSQAFGGSIAESGPLGSALPGSAVVSMLKDGAGTLILAGDSGASQFGYSGGTTVGAGTLLADNLSGSATGTGPVSVLGGAIFGGNGSIAGSLTIARNGTLSPGDPSGGVGTLAVGGDLNMQQGAILAVDLGMPANSDRMTVGGALTLAGTLDVNPLAGFGPGTYDLIDYGTFAGGSLAIGSAPSGFAYQVTEMNNQVDLIVSPPGVPEPGSLALLVTGLAVLIAAHRRRGRAGRPHGDSKVTDPPCSGATGPASMGPRPGHWRSPWHPDRGDFESISPGRSDSGMTLRAAPLCLTSRPSTT